MYMSCRWDRGVNETGSSFKPSKLLGCRSGEYVGPSKTNKFKDDVNYIITINKIMNL